MVLPMCRHMIVFVCIISTLLCMPSCRDRQERRSASSPQRPASPQYGGTYHKPLQQEPLTLDPASTASTYAVAVVQQIFDGLVQFDTDLNVVPSLAQTWSASPDGRVWTFQLRQGVTFHHGREVTADDVVYSLTRLVDPRTDSPRPQLFKYIRGAHQLMTGASRSLEGVRALDRYTVEITLSESYAPFIAMLGIAQAKVVPREEVERLGAEFGRHPVGTGPFRLRDWVADQDIVLEAYEKYFEGRPFVDRVHYHIIHDVQAILAAFEQGQLADAGVPALERQRLSTDPRFQFVRKPFLATLFLWIDMREGPLRQLQVRQAINYAIDRDSINRDIRDNSLEQARGILPRGMPGYNPELQGYPYDVARAQQLLVEAGYPAGQGIPPLELWSSSVADTVVSEHEAIKRDLEHIGLRVELKKAESWKQFRTTVLGKRPGALYRYAWFADFPDPDNFLSVLFHSQSPDNHAHYENPEVDRLLEQAQHESDESKRIQLYRQAEARIVADAPTVNLVYYTLERLFQPYVHGMQLNALGEPYMPLKKIWLDTSHHDSLTPTNIP